MKRKEDKMIVHVGERLDVFHPTQAVKDYCKESLIVDNPDFYKKEQMGKWTGGTPRELALFETNGDDLVLPFGCLNDLWQLYPEKDAYKIQIRPISPISYESGISLYPYQKSSVEAAIRAKNGILVMPCGAGKTSCGLEIISRVGGRALWLTHTHDLLMQSRRRAETVLCVPEGGYGSITAGKVEIGSHITFATVQTMAKLTLSQYRDVWDVIIVDEAQHCCGTPTRATQFYRVLSQLSARYKIGLTATPKRADGLERAMFALLGPTIHEVSRAEVAHTTCPIHIQRVYTGWQPDYDCVLMSDGTIDYMKVIDAMTHDEKRNRFIFRWIGALDGTRLVLGNRVELLQKLTAEYNEVMRGKLAVCLSGQGQSEKAKRERKEALEKLNSGELHCVFATYQLAKEGLDVPNLRYVVFVTPEKDETTVIQSVGRVGRKADGKEYGTVIDFVDEFGLYQGWAKMRLGYYEKLDCEIEEDE